GGGTLPPMQCNAKCGGNSCRCTADHQCNGNAATNCNANGETRDDQTGEFRARDRFSEGFDPPLADAGEAWTSVAGSGPYSVNERTKLVFTSDEFAMKCELAVANDSSGLISVSPTSITSKETELRISGLRGDSIAEGTIEVRTKDSGTVVT